MFGLSVRTILDIGIVATLMAAFATYTVHERNIGKAEIRAEQAKTVAAAKIKKGEVEKRAQEMANVLVGAYSKAISAPPAPDAPRLRCRAPESTARVPANGGAGQVDHGKADVPATGAKDFDPGPAIDTLLRNDDAQIEALQKYIETCQQLGMCKK